MLDEHNRLFEDTWEVVAAQIREGTGERHPSFLDVLESGDADTEEVAHQFAQVCLALAHIGYFRTLAVLLRGLGYAEILDRIKDHHVQWRMPPKHAWKAIQSAGIEVDTRSLIEALQEIHDNSGPPPTTVENGRLLDPHRMDFPDW